MPPQGEEEAPARRSKQAPKREMLSADEIEFVRSLVIHEDKAAIVVNKPPGLATQGGTKTKDHLDRLLDGLAEGDAPRPKLVHRLDKDTSGALGGGPHARAPPPSSRRAFPGGRRARSIGPWSSACRRSTTA